MAATEIKPETIEPTEDNRQQKESKKKRNKTELSDYIFPWDYDEIDTEHAWLLTSGWYSH